MTNIARRDFVLGTGAAGLALAAPGFAIAQGRKKVVVVGGGIGGCTVASYVRLGDPSIEVTLIEPNKTYHTCFMSNEVIGGERKLESIAFGYDGLRKRGVNVVHDTVTGIDAAGRTVKTAGGGSYGYDRLVVAPGIDFKWTGIEGYDQAAAEKIPHAWKAGPQTVLLRKQLEAMPAGGTVVMSIPLAPFRCPPGPYERASMIAMFLKQHKPKSKIVVLDANPDIVSKKGLFLKGWKKHYEGIIDYRPAKKVTEIDAAKKTVLIEGLEDVRGDVVNLIPPQRAGAIAVAAGVVGPDKNWCPINPTTFESTVKKDIHVIGDACIAGAMPKSGYSANSEAKTCATNIVNAMNGRELVDMSGINTCFSYLSAKEAVSVTGVYLVDKAKSAIVAAPGSVAVSPDLSELEAIYAESWLKNILTEMSS